LCPFQQDQVGVVKYPIASLRSKKYNQRKRKEALELIKQTCSNCDLVKEYVQNIQAGAKTTPNYGGYNTEYYSIPYGFIEFKCN